MSTKMNFQTETKKLLDLMIHSIYTNKEIFLRELISNSSDAIDKIRFESLKNPEILNGDNKFEIKLELKDNKLIIEDNGIGMSYDEVIENIGTIARSGTKKFIEELKKEENNTNDLIGQFGVGFYSAFMVAEKVTLETKKYNEREGVIWKSEGNGEFTIDKTEKNNRGTKITLELRKDIEDEIKLDEDKIKELIKKYSNYIKYPIKMEIEKEGKKELEILNSMESLWMKNKKDIKKEEYDEFYKETFHDWIDPFEIIHTKAEGSIEYTALLFIPSKLPIDYYSKNYKRGIQLYSKNVFIMEKYEDLLPEYLGFIKGLVDSPDFSLNISRELLQQSRQLQIVKKNIEKKVLNTLENILKKDQKRYIEFWEQFGRSIKSGIYENLTNKEKLENLLIFKSSFEKDYTTLNSYIERMKEDQKYIYFASGENVESIEKLPQLEAVLDNGYEVLYFNDSIDEFLVQMMREFKGKEFKSISSNDLNLKNEEEVKKLEKENGSLLEEIKEILKEKVSEVKLSSRLKTSPVCIVTGNMGISTNMEKILKELDQLPFKADKVLEINPNHDLFKTMEELHRNGEKEKLRDYSELLYNQALILEGLKPENPTELVNLISKLITK
ncbi:chaperone protein HtpG [Tepiditoga spiralis]|uniref:Chaperone protein HtpG n=1 Tax=Tepiditoga spiralis TaxID=2108365 RepID=A0A7G1GC06_9BACT|nr:molecular chaperone HtpG [Tepiditoga spiralis]BBE31569.1 chaperone protein HtpG [Tepiditoga spiralis]